MAALRVDDVVQTPQRPGVRMHRAATQTDRRHQAFDSSPRRPTLTTNVATGDHGAIN